MSNQEKRTPTVTDYLAIGALVSPILLLGGWVPLGMAAICVGAGNLTAFTVTAADKGIRRAVRKAQKITR